MTLIFSKEALLPPRYTLEWVEQTSDVYENGHLGEYVPVKVLENDRVTAPDHFQDTRLVSFSTKVYEELPRNPLEYEPGDVLMVYPYNLQETVELAAEALGYELHLLEKPFRLVANDPNLPLPPKWLIKGGAVKRETNYF